MPSKSLAEGVAIGAFRSTLFSFLFLFLFSFCYRRCGSVKVKLVLNFSMELNSVYTIQNCKVFIGMKTFSLCLVFPRLQNSVFFLFLSTDH